MGVHDGPEYALASHLEISVHGLLKRRKRHVHIFGTKIVLKTPADRVVSETASLNLGEEFDIDLGNY
jgi:hypothetical protein